MGGQIIAVWGNSGVGKTTVSIKLARELAERKKNSMIILSDITAPDINVLIPFEKNDKSMGDIWTNPEVCEGDILNKCIITNTDYVCLLGYKHGENIFSNTQYTKRGIVETLKVIKNMTDYVIIDCGSDFPSNILSTVALEISDKVIRLCGADLKAFSFFDSNLPMLADSRFHTEEHMKVLSKGKWFQAKDAAITKYGGVDFILDYQEEIEKQLLEGEVFNPSVKEYNSVLVKMVDYLLGESNKENIIRKKSKEKKTHSDSDTKAKICFKLKKKDKGDIND